MAGYDSGPNRAAKFELPLRNVKGNGLNLIRCYPKCKHRCSRVIIREVLFSNTSGVVLARSWLKDGLAGVLGRIAVQAIAESTVDPSVLQGLDSSIAMIRRIHDVRVVDNCGDSRIDAIRCCGVIRNIHIFSRVNTSVDT